MNVCISLQILLLKRWKIIVSYDGHKKSVEDRMGINENPRSMQLAEDFCNKTKQV